MARLMRIRKTMAGLMEIRKTMARVVRINMLKWSRVDDPALLLTYMRTVLSFWLN